MEGGDARNGSTGTSQKEGSGVDGTAKPLPPCCVKARAAAPESEGKCHATVVSGWFSEPRSRCGMTSLVLNCIILSTPTSQQKYCKFLIIQFSYLNLVASDAGKTSKVQYYNNPMWPGTSLTGVFLYCRIDVLVIRIIDHRNVNADFSPT